MRREYKGELRLIMDDEIVRSRIYTTKKRRRQLITEWTDEIKRLNTSKKHEYFISIIVNT
jgi:ribulose 1,5-bisphosphate carboxylase large subunit-like protein